MSTGIIDRVHLPEREGRTAICAGSRNNVIAYGKHALFRQNDLTDQLGIKGAINRILDPSMAVFAMAIHLGILELGEEEAIFQGGPRSAFPQTQLSLRLCFSKPFHVALQLLVLIGIKCQGFEILHSAAGPIIKDLDALGTGVFALRCRV